MNLVGDKIYLRNIEDEDINVLKTLINDENVSKDVVGWSKPISSMEHFTWFNNLKNDSNFRYMNVSTDSIKFPFHRENGTEQRFFAFIDEFGRLNSFFFPKKNMQDMTRIYLSGVKSKMEYFDKN